MGRLAYLLIAATLLSAGCKKSEPAPASPAEQPGPVAAGGAADTAAAPAGEAVPAAEAKAEPAGPRPVADPGSERTIRSGERPATVVEAQTLTATRRHSADGHTWLAFPMPKGAEAADASNTEVSPVRFRYRGDGHAYAVRVPGATRSQDEVIVRFVGDAPPTPLKFTVERDGYAWWFDAFASHHTQELTVEVPAGLSGDAAMTKRFFVGLARDLRAMGQRGWGPLPPYFAFAAARAERLGDVTTYDGGARPTPEAKTDMAETMSLYTGMTSINEALQTDRGLMLRSTLGDPKTDTVALASVEGVPQPQHPWDAMLTKAQKVPKIEPMAKHIPHDMLYVHMSDLRTAIRLANDADDWLESLIHAVEARPAVSHLIARYERELMLERMGLAETLGPLAVDGVAITAGDPFVREGTDVSLVFEVKERAILMTALAAYEAKARARTPDLTESEWKAGDHTVRLVRSPDGRVRQHRLELGNLIILSNSRGAIERFVAVADGKATSLADSGDFRWMRAEYPYDPAAEDGFVFLGDAFVAHAVSPRTKILQGRRMAAKADLMAVGFAQLLHGALEGKPADSADALVASGLLDKRELTQADGSPILFDPKIGARSERWGRVDALVPLADLPLTHVSPAEQQAYERFRDTYQSYWRGYIDPIAVRLRRSPDGKTLSADARMMPLVSGTEYDELIGKVGATAIPPPKKVSGARWTLAIGDDAPLRGELGGMGRSMNLGGLEWLGQYVMVGVASRSGIWDAALENGGREIPQLPAPEDNDPPARRAREAAVIARLPVYVGFHIANPVALAAALTSLRAMADTTSPGLVVWGMADPYRDIPIVTIGAGKTDSMPEFRGIRLYYAIAGSTFVASLDLGTLQTVIDDALASAAEAPKAEADAEEPMRQADLRVELDPNAPWLAKTAALFAESKIRQASWRAYRDIETLAAGLGGLPADGEPRRDAALGFFGYEPVAGPGATFSIDGEGRVLHSVYGTEVSPRFPALPVAGSPLSRLATELSRASFGLAFEGQDETRGLRAMMRWERR
ncbi:MAG: hypothetical protein R3F39_05800 [Myxococcota bacterium]